MSRNFSQFTLGVAYYHGDGVSIDKVEAIKWYRLAANQGIAQAQFNQFNLGVSYLKGDGVDIDKVEGLQWIKLAAENGYPHAITSLESLNEE